jgi:hypothetical protein
MYKSWLEPRVTAVGLLSDLDEYPDMEDTMPEMLMPDHEMRSSDTGRRIRV